jgi:hypothetical protein
MQRKHTQRKWCFTSWFGAVNIFGDPYENWTFRFMFICCLMQPNFVDVCNYEQYSLLIRSTIFEQKQLNHVFFSIFYKSVSKNDGIIVHTKISTTVAVEFFRTQQCKSNPNHCSSDSSIILVPAVQPFLSWWFKSFFKKKNSFKKIIWWIWFLLHGSTAGWSPHLRVPLALLAAAAAMAY